MSFLTYGVGYNSRREHKTKVSGKHTIAYQTWFDMIRRCYSPKKQEKRPTYIGCTVADCWHDYQDFADWFYGHKYSELGYQIDKDILKPENKVYSPETCCFVPSDINNLLISNGVNRGEYVQGVSLKKQSGKYLAQLSVDGRVKNLGHFDTASEAYQAYKAAKEAHVKVMAEEWKGRIDPRVFTALMNWRLET